MKVIDVVLVVATEIVAFVVINIVRDILGHPAHRAPKELLQGSGDGGRRAHRGILIQCKFCCVVLCCVLLTPQVELLSNYQSVSFVVLYNVWLSEWNTYE